MIIIVQAGFSQASLTITSSTGTVGSNLNVNITATDISDMQGFQFTLDYNNERLSYAGCSNWSGGTNGAAVQITQIPMQGKITFVYNDASINIGSGLFFTITFTVIGSGAAAINWSDTPTPRELSNSVPTVIPCNYTNGQISISGSIVPDSLSLSNIIFENGQTQCYNALQRITIGGVAPSFLIPAGAGVTIIAGQKIDLLPGVTVYSGGNFHGYITANGQYCNTLDNLSLQDAKSGEKPIAETEIPGHHEVAFTIYPNPTHGNFELEVHAGSISPEVMISIYGQLGNHLFDKVILNARKMDFSLENQPAGLYIIVARAGMQMGKAKIIKQ